MKTLANPLYTLILSLITWAVFLFLIFPGPMEFNKLGAYVWFTMGIFPALLLIALIQMIIHKFKNESGWLAILSTLPAGLLLLKYIYTVKF